MVASVGSVSRTSLLEYANVLVELDAIVAQYKTDTDPSLATRLLHAKTVARLLFVMRDMQRLGLTTTDELSSLLKAVIEKAAPVGAAVDGKKSDVEIVAALNTFIGSGSSAATLINNALDPVNWQTDAGPVSIRDAISDVLFFEYYRSADATIASTMGALANRLQTSKAFLSALNDIYQGVTWNPGTSYIDANGELQDAITAQSTGKTLQLYDIANHSWNDPTYFQLTFGAESVDTNSNSILLTNSFTDGQRIFSDGDQVFYKAPTDPIEGLLSSCTYWVTNATSDSFQLSRTKTAASPIPFSSTGSTGQSQTLERYSMVDTATNSIYIKDHNLTSGTELLYTSNIAIGGLRSGAIYSPNVLDANTFTLSSSSSGSTIPLTFDLISKQKGYNLFSAVQGRSSWFNLFNNDGVSATMTNGISELQTMIAFGLLESGSDELETANRILSIWECPYSTGGYESCATESATARMWGDEGFHKLIQDGINATSRLNEQSQLDLTRALTVYDFFTRSATNFVARESDSIKQIASNIRS